MGFKEWVWPDIQDMDDARKATSAASGVSFFISIITAVITYLQVTGKIDFFKGLGSEAYVDAFFFLLIGAGLCWRSRIAALAGLLLYLAEQFYMIKSGMGKGSLLTLYFTLVFLAGVRGSFAYHQFKKEGQIDRGGDPMQAAAESEKVPGTGARHLFSKKILMLSLAILFLVGGVAVAAAFVVPHFLGKPSLLNPANPAGGAASVVDPGPAERVGEGRTFKMKSGQVIRGKIVVEDDFYYTVETSGGRQEIVIKEDLAE